MRDENIAANSCSAIEGEVQPGLYVITIFTSDITRFMSLSIRGTAACGRAAKRGFCMLDTDPNPVPVGGVPPGPGKFRSCGAIGIPGNQGVSAGWADTYRFTLAGQYFVLDGGDGQAPVPPGDYIIRHQLPETVECGCK